MKMMLRSSIARALYTVNVFHKVDSVLREGSKKF
jgi:hypothetical protein